MNIVIVGAGYVGLVSAACFAEFRQKVLADEDTWIVLEHEADLAGLPL